MKIEWNKVTRFSATMALVLFVALPFFGFWLGTDYGSIKQYERDVSAEAIKVLAAPVSIATKIIDYIPATPPQNTTAVVASCWTNSIAAPYRDDAWRCMVGNEIHDPCFQIPGSAELFCDPGPKNQAAEPSMIISLAKPLPEPQEHRSPTAPYDGAWLIELKGGIVCAPFTGTLPFSDKGEVATYGCSDKRLIFGINADEKIWTATVGSLGAAIEHSPPPLVDKATVAIVAAWK